MQIHTKDHTVKPTLSLVDKGAVGGEAGVVMRSGCDPDRAHERDQRALRRSQNEAGNAAIVPGVHTHVLVVNGNRSVRGVVVLNHHFRRACDFRWSDVWRNREKSDWLYM